MLKNYTSSVPVERSIAFIENKLVRRGAQNIIKRYNPQTKKLECIFFTMETKDGTFSFKVPAKVDQVEKILLESKRKITPSVLENVRAQAERTAWKIMSDWVEVQMALIQLEQVEFLQIFLPYIYIPKKDLTYFEMLKDSGFKQLTYMER